MANVAEKQADTAAKKADNKFVGFFKKLGLRIARSFKDMIAEMKKVTWPSKAELINYSLVVLAFMVVMGVIIGLCDGASGWIVSLIVG